MTTESAVQLLLPDGRAMRVWARISGSQIVCTNSDNDTVASWTLSPKSVVGLAKSRPRCVSVKSIEDLIIDGSKVTESSIEFVGGTSEIIDKWVVAIAKQIDKPGDIFMNNVVGSKTLNPVQKITVNSGNEEGKRISLVVGNSETVESQAQVIIHIL